MTEWEIHTGDNTSIVADVALSDPNELNTVTRGDTANYVFSNVLTKFQVDSGETYTIASGNTERYDLAVVKGTLTIEGTLECDQINIDGGTVDGSGTLIVNDDFAFELADVQNYSHYAGKFTIRETLSSQQAYSENVPPTANIDTLLVGVEPQQELQDKTIEGYWGLIENITDNRNRPLSNNQVELQITVLAPYDEYADHSAVETQLKT